MIGKVLNVEMWIRWGKETKGSNRDAVNYAEEEEWEKGGQNEESECEKRNSSSFKYTEFKLNLIPQ